VVKVEPSLPQAILGFVSFTHSGWLLFLAEFSRIQGLATRILDTRLRKKPARMRV
jgi:hypothetical protein